MLKELETIYQNTIYIYVFFDVAKFADFQWKIADARRT